VLCLHTSDSSAGPPFGFILCGIFFNAAAKPEPLTVLVSLRGKWVQRLDLQNASGVKLMKKQLASLGIGLALSVATILAPSNSFAGHGWHGHGWHGHGWHGHGWGWGGIGLGLALGGIGIGLGPRYVYGGYPYYGYDYPYYRSYYYGYRPYYGYGYRRPYYGTYWGHGRRVARRVNRRWD
jgi:hypothetical protein